MKLVNGNEIFSTQKERKATIQKCRMRKQCKEKTKENKNEILAEKGK